MNIWFLKNILELSFNEKSIFILSGKYLIQAELLHIILGDREGKFILADEEVYALPHSSEELKQFISCKEGVELPLRFLDLPMRAHVCLYGWMDSPVRKTVGDILYLSAKELAAEQRQLGENTANKIKDILKIVGF